MFHARRYTRAVTQLDTPVSFIATAKPAASRDFYENTLGLRCVSDGPFAIVFALGPITLRVQKVDSVPDVGFTVLGWEVADVRKLVDELAAAGVRFEKYAHLTQEESGVWRAPSGASVAWFRDPDGNTLSLTEP